MKHINKLYLLIIILLSTVVCHGADLEKMYQPYYKQLDKVRENKQEELVRYLKRVESVAKSIGSDSEMKDLFIMKRHLYNQTKTAAMTQEQKDIQQFLRNSIIDRYMDRYLVFYDLLFIDEAGDIFYTNRRQGDYRKNIFKGKLAKTALSKHLKNDSKYSFVDYQNFEVSAEPSAFFMVPFVMNGKKLGWFVLQFAVNRIDDMFSIESNLGRTGEVFLVNEDQYMLTDSRFTAESTILKKHLSSDNILPKFKEKSGHKLVVDYRGFRALSSFNVISVLGSKWLIIAKIDEDEVLTSEYKKMSNRKQNIFIKDTINSINIKKVEKYILKKDIEVDMDEFKRATNGQTLYTHGVSTCTALIFSLKEKFAYMAHMSGYDKIYGGDGTDLLNHIMKRIDEFDAVRNEKRLIKVYIVSPNVNYDKNIIDALLRWGLMLSQINIIVNPQAKYADISHDYTTQKTLINWNVQMKKVKYGMDMDDVHSLAEYYYRTRASN